jgi:hypothetical protein
MRAYVRGEKNGKLSKSGEKYFDEFIDDFWKKPGNIHKFLLYIELLNI